MTPGAWSGRREGRVALFLTRTDASAGAPLLELNIPVEEEVSVGVSSTDVMMLFSGIVGCVDRELWKEVSWGGRLGL